MIHGVKYNEVTGEIEMSISVTDMDGLEIQAAAGYPVLETLERFDGAEFYVVNERVISRPKLTSLRVGPTSFTTEGHITVSGIPVGTTLYYPDGQLVITDGFFEWGAVDAGEYTLTLVHFPHLTETINAKVTEA